MAASTDTLICEQCGIEFDVRRYIQGRNRYCSRGCKEDAYVASGRQALAARKSYLKRRYGLTPEQVAEMEQVGCAICGRTDWNGRHTRPHIDHDHATGRVRGMLCHSCNVGLGSFGEDPDRLEAAARYLRG